MQKRYVLFVLALTILGCISEGRTDESPFGYIYAADSIPKGRWEFEQWTTVRTEKAAGSYTSLDFRDEVEYGFTDRFQASFYLNSSYLHSRDVPDPDDASTHLENQSAFDLNGVSLEFKYQVFSPDKGPIGLSLYAEPEMGVREALTGEDITERSVEFKLIAEKDLLDNRLILASNIVFEPEWEREDETRSKELANEYSLGASYRFAAGWFGGVEFLNRRNFEDQDFGKQRASAFYLGPALHYAQKSWWATLTVLPQIAGNPRGLGLDANGNPVSDSFRTLGEYEKMEVRFRLGIAF